VSALLWGVVAASSLTLGAVLAIVRTWRDGVIGAVLAFGAGALIASVSFELAEEGLSLGGAVPVAVGLAVGALAFFGGDRGVERWGGRSRSGGAGIPLAVGALLDGIPEQAVLGIGLAGGHGVSAALLVAIFVSNLPESVGSSADMLAGGRSRKSVLTLWLAVSAVCALATGFGYLIADSASVEVRGAIDGFAAGALLTMLIDAMAPEARKKAKDYAGLCTVVGFAVAAGLSLI
jgi:ZIP family zinc transporter